MKGPTCRITESLVWIRVVVSCSLLVRIKTLFLQLQHDISCLEAMDDWVYSMAYQGVSNISFSFNWPLRGRNAQDFFVVWGGGDSAIKMLGRKEGIKCAKNSFSISRKIQADISKSNLIFSLKPFFSSLLYDFHLFGWLRPSRPL